MSKSRECPVCGQHIPVVKGRLVIHWGRQYQQCPGSGSEK